MELDIEYMGTKVDWAEVKRDYEGGCPLGQLAKRYHVKKAIINERAEEERWEFGVKPYRPGVGERQRNDMAEATGRLQDRRSQVEQGMEGLNLSLDKLAEEQRDVARSYWEQAKRSVDTAGKWLDVLDDPATIKDKVQKSPPDKLALAYGILSDQALKRLEKMLSVIKEAVRTLNPPTPVIDIQAASIEDELAKRGLGLTLRLIEIEERNGRPVARMAPMDTDIELDGRRVSVPREIEIPLDVTG